MDEKIKRLQTLGHDFFYYDSTIEISLPNEDVATKVLLDLSEDILDGRVSCLRMNLPNKIIFVSAHDKNHVLVRAEASNDKASMN